MPLSNLSKNCGFYNQPFWKKSRVKLKNEQLYKNKIHFPVNTQVRKLNKLKRVISLHKSLCRKNWICDTYVRTFIDWQTDNSCIQSNISLSKLSLICWEINNGNRSREDKRKEGGKLKSWRMSRFKAKKQRFLGKVEKKIDCISPTPFIDWQQMGQFFKLQFFCF